MIVLGRWWAIIAAGVVVEIVGTVVVGMHLARINKRYPQIDD